MTFVDVSLTPEIQTSGYPNSLALFTGGGYQLRLSQAGSNTLFTATVDGTTISPNFLSGQQTIDFGTPVITYTTFTEVVPEPSTWALLLGGLGLLAFWRARARRSVN